MVRKTKICKLVRMTMKTTPRLRTLIFLILPVPLLLSCLFDPQPFDEGAWRRQVENQDPALLYAPHEENGRYYNPWMEDEKTFSQFLKWRFTRSVDYTDEEESYLPQSVPDLMKRIAALPPDTDFVVWIGHATFLIRVAGSYWLTDPMLSDRALLPRRVTPPALSMAELGGLDGELTVVVSHNHYDHLDKHTIRALPPQAKIIVPLGLKDYVETLHEGEVIEIDWWETIGIHGAQVTGLPAQHWSRRIGQGRNETLWASYMIETPGPTIYYGADSGSFIGYREFGKKFARIDYALLPITAYQPRWFMHYAHTNVDEALLAFEELKARWFVPTQWGTFRLGDNPPGYPMLDLMRTLEDKKLDTGPYLRPHLGEIIVLSRQG